MNRKTWIRLLGGIVLLPGLSAVQVFAEGQAGTREIKQLWGLVSPLKGGGWELQFQLGGQGLTDEGLKHVVSLDNVVVLNLRDTKITSAGLSFRRFPVKII